jgi:hypothetical protein
VTKEKSEIQAALASVMDGLLSRAEAERAKSTPYQLLFGQFKDNGLAAAVFEAEQKMSQIAMDLMQLLESAAGIKIDNDVFAVVMGLPLAMHLAEEDIRKKDGLACCVDKASLLLRTFLYERLQLNVEAIPFERRAPAAPAGGAV